MSKAIKTVHQVHYGPKPDDHHKPGTTLVIGKDIKPEEAEYLLDRQAAIEVGATEGVAAQDEPVTQEAFSEAVAKLDDENAAHWTKAGKPDLGALEEVGGIKVSGKQRDALWDAHEAAKGE